MKKVGLAVALLIIVSGLVYYFAFYKSSKDETTNGALTKDNAELVISVYGDLDYQSNKIFYMNSDDFSSEELEKNEISIFVYEDIPNNIKALKKVDSEGKDYLVLKKQGITDMDSVISTYSLSIPFYDIITTNGEDIKVFAYGGKISKGEKTYKSNVLAGNFSIKDLEKQLEVFLLEQ